jgi:hypothetical protein
MPTSHRFSPVLLVAALAALAPPPARATTWNENPNYSGDMSNDPAFPSQITFFHSTDNENYIAGSIGGGDVDVITFKIPDFHTLDWIKVYQYMGAGQSFLGIQSGKQWTAGLGGSVNPAALLGWTHFGETAPPGTQPTDDILDDLATPKMGSAGFTRPLPPGFYTLLIQDTGPALQMILQFGLTYEAKSFGDFRPDVKINRQDLDKWRTDYGPGSGSDATGDGISDGQDFIVWQRNVGRDGTVAVAAPEPAGTVLSAAALLALHGVRRRRRAAR